jgi:hypothetical protein
MAYENIVAVFQTLSVANAAVSELQAAGIGESDIKLHSSANAIPSATDGKGVWGHLLGGDISHSDLDVYEKCISKGWVVISVTALLEKAEMVMLIISNHSPVDLDEGLETYGSDENSPAEKVQNRIIRRFSSASNPPAEL